MKRYLSLDLLRGLSIFGMVFSAIIPYGVLPAWMYHIQNPPPGHAFDGSVSGTGWVDLVFPVFIFCMGVAIPLAGRRKLAFAHNGTITSLYVKETLERFGMLWLFSYLYVFLNFSTSPGWWPQFFTIIGFLLLFPLYYIYGKTFPAKRRTILRVSGLVAIAALIAVGHFAFGEVISIYRSGIIIFLLAFLYLFGALVWYFTRDNLRARFWVFAGLVVFSALAMFFDLQPKLYAVREIRWFFNMEYFYFLMILIPATYIGDLVQKRISMDFGEDPVKQTGGITPSYLLSLGAVLVYLAWLMVALYRNMFLANLIISIVLPLVIHQLSKVGMTVYKKEIQAATLLAISGALAIYAEGSVSKSPCTIGYCLTTAAFSIYLLIMLDFVVHKSRNSYFVRIFAGAGSNPLMSYVAFGSFVMPLFKITGLVYIYNIAYPAGYPWIGVLRAALVVLLTMALVARLSEKKIFWRA
jgi:predicted acyltransferase